MAEEIKSDLPLAAPSLANNPPAVAPVVNAPAKTVTLTQEEFDAIMGRMNDLEKTTKAIIDVGGKNNALKIEQMRAEGKLVKSVKVRRIDGKYIIGWRTLKDEVYISEGKLIENQTIEVFFDDLSKREMPLRQWATLPQYVPAEVIAENKDANGNITFTVRDEQGKEFAIGLSFVN